MNVIIRIDGKDAIPVRALPFVSPAITPRTVAAELSVDPRGLGYAYERLKARTSAETQAPEEPESSSHWDRPWTDFVEAAPEDADEDTEEPDTDADRRPRPLVGVRAYYLDAGEIREFPSAHWPRYERAIIEREAQSQPGDPEYRNTIAVLPVGAFIWRTDFERVYSWMHQEPESTAEGPPRDAWVTPCVSSDVQRIIMEGFEDLLTEDEPAPFEHRKDTVRDLDPRRETTLLLVIAALVKMQPLDITKRYPAADKVIAELELMGGGRDRKAIADVFKQVTQLKHDEGLTD